MQRDQIFLIVCLFLLLTACRTQRRAATVLEVSPRSEIRFGHTIVLPEAVSHTELEVSDRTDTVYWETPESILEMTRLRGENDSLLRFRARIVRKAIQFTDTVRVVFETLTLRRPGVDSIYVIAGGDTVFHHSYPNDWAVAGRAGEVRDALEGRRSPWWLLFLALLGLLAAAGRRKGRAV
jgi:hypothetical protein